MLLQERSKFVFIGDSITDCGRARPIGEAPFGGLGDGYVSLVDAMLQNVYPGLHIRTVNMGIGGNTVRHLVERWSEDVVQLAPDWLSIMIGINDVWRQFDHPHMSEQHVLLDEYEKTLDQLAEQTRPTVQGLLFLSPFYIEPNQADPMRKMMDQYGAAMKRVAQKYDAIFVDVQAVFDALLHHFYPVYLAADRVHPNVTGHLAIARAVLNTLQFEWPNS